ncbi:RICIN domain-containing protein [Streptomyces sp. NPDC020422]|uniref:RICIN domain-containing protein n=1 Tax=Streptomyces sp. NPDC020422 TaxID=3365074 RepID=UPI0037945D45
MRTRPTTLALAVAAVSLSLALPSQASAAEPPTAPASVQPRAAGGAGGAYADARTGDAQQRAFWKRHDDDGTFRPFRGALPDWKPQAQRPAPRGTGRVVQAPPTAPTARGEGRLAAGSPAEERLRATTGRIRIAWPDAANPGTWWISACTGNVITSANKDVIATARHCIPHDAQGRINSQAEYEFTPGYWKDADGTEHAPYGKWTLRSLGVVGDFTTGTQTNDSAFLALNPRGGVHVQDAVGSSGYRFGISALPGRVVIAGIPAADNQFHTCAKQPYWGPDTPPQILGSGGPCTGADDLSGGASGGPLLDGDTFDGGPTQIGDYSGSLGSAPAAAVWRDAAFSVFDSLQGNGGAPAHDRITTLTNANANLADLYGYDTANGAAVYGYHATGGENQRWHLWDKGNGYFLIENRYTETHGLTLANARVLDYNFSNGTAWSHQVNGTGSDNQLWRFRATPGRPGWFTIRSKQGDYCLTAPNGEGSLTVGSCTTADGLDSMQWKLQ